jgi:anthranilate phosphoribosyltransferase
MNWKLLTDELSATRISRNEMRRDDLSVHTSDDLNNRRVRQLIDQFNAEEAYSAELRSVLAKLCKLVDESADLAKVIAALRKARQKWPTPPPVNAVGLGGC